jgi:hypothetical protein
VSDTVSRRIQTEGPSSLRKGQHWPVHGGTSSSALPFPRVGEELAAPLPQALPPRLPNQCSHFLLPNDPLGMGGGEDIRTSIYIYFLKLQPFKHYIYDVHNIFSLVDRYVIYK